MQADEIAFRSDRQYRTMLIVWFVFVISLSAFFVFCLLLAPASTDQDLSGFGIVFVAFGFIFVVDSFFWKRKSLARAMKRHDPSLVDKAYIVAFAMCEVAGLFAVFLRFETVFRYYYVSFALAGVAMLLHFPRKDHVLAAYEVG
jgi:drug/metabolite transporter superfamily protein YnfA